MLMLSRKFAKYRLHMAGATQNNQKCLIFIVVPQVISKGRKFNIKKYINENK